MGRLQNNPSIGWVHPKSTHARPLAWGNNHNEPNEGLESSMKKHNAQQQTEIPCRLPRGKLGFLEFRV
jgi:hypothetical protein